MKVIQLIPHFNYGDAIGNEALEIDRILKENGFETVIMADEWHEKLADKCRKSDFQSILPEDIVICHKASGDHYTEAFTSLTCKKGMVYHNITPGSFFKEYDRLKAWNQDQGRKQLLRSIGKVDFMWADSSFNAKDLEKMGFDPGIIRVLPFIMPKKKPEDHRSTGIMKPQDLPVNNAAKEPEQKPEEHESTGIMKPQDLSVNNAAKEPEQKSGTKILFIGRIAPNKKQEDIIKAFCYYKRYADKYSRLYLVGSYKGYELYYARLKGLCAELGLKDDDVIFTGHVTDEEKWNYMRNSDIFLCMSEHEGFCVPLLEAFECDIPVLAYNSSAVPETLGKTGGLIKEKNYPKIAAAIRHIMEDAKLRQDMLKKQRESLARFDNEKTGKIFLELFYEVQSGCNDKLKDAGKPSDQKLKEAAAGFSQNDKLSLETGPDVQPADLADRNIVTEITQREISDMKPINFKPLGKIKNEAYKSLEGWAKREQLDYYLKKVKSRLV